MLTIGSLFSGIGGFEYGLEATGGFKVKWQCEINPFCWNILHQNWPDAICYNDVNTILDSTPAPDDVDIITGGFPCQPVSVAGLKKGNEDARWMWPQFLNVINYIHPKYVLIENVPNLLNLGMQEVLSGLWKSGYDAEWAVISAAQFGAWHLRKRLWILAYPVCDGVQRTRFAHYLSETRAQGDIKGLSSWPGDWLPEAYSNSSANLALFSGKDDGLSPWVDQVKALGNSIVPNIPFWIGQKILEFEREE